jgi:hypothetical protein
LPKTSFVGHTPVLRIEERQRCVTLRGDLVIDPAAGGFGVLHAALRWGREFIGFDAEAAAVERFQQRNDAMTPDQATAWLCPKCGIPTAPTSALARVFGHFCHEHKLRW